MKKIILSLVFFVASAVSVIDAKSCGCTYRVISAQNVLLSSVSYSWNVPDGAGCRDASEGSLLTITVYIKGDNTYRVSAASNIHASLC